MLVELANGALVEGDMVGALRTLLEAEAQDDRLPELHHSKALAYLGKHDLSSALSSARKSVEIKPNYADANNTLGKILIDAGKYNEAVTYLSVAANDPLYADAYRAHTNLGILYYRQGQDDPSSTHFTKAVELAPTQACIAHYYQGHLNLKKGAMGGAIRSYDLATQRFCAGFGDAHLALGIAYERNKEYERARKKFLDIKQSFPNTKVAEQAMDRLKYLP